MLRRQLARKLARFGLHERRGAGSTESVITREIQTLFCHSTIGNAPPGLRLPPGATPQGHLVFQYNPDEGQSLYRLGSQPTASCRNVRMACPPEQANRGVT